MLTPACRRDGRCGAANARRVPPDGGKRDDSRRRRCQVDVLPRTLARAGAHGSAQRPVRQDCSPVIPTNVQVAPGRGIARRWCLDAATRPVLHPLEGRGSERRCCRRSPAAARACVDWRVDWRWPQPMAGLRLVRGGTLVGDLCMRVRACAPMRKHCATSPWLWARAAQKTKAMNACAWRCGSVRRASAWLEIVKLRVTLWRTRSGHRLRAVQRMPCATT